MNHKSIDQIKAEIAPILKKAGVIRSAVFGSFARNQESKKSDIDILVEFQGEKSLLDLIQLKRDLEEILERPVDLVTYKSLPPYLRDSILRERIPIYE